MADPEGRGGGKGGTGRELGGATLKVLLIDLSRGGMGRRIVHTGERCGARILVLSCAAEQEAKGIAEGQKGRWDRQGAGEECSAGRAAGR